MKITVINGSPKGKEGNTSVMADAFLKGAADAGAETVQICLAEKETEMQLVQNLLPEDVYLQQINDYFDGFLDNLKHPYVKAWS